MMVWLLMCLEPRNTRKKTNRPVMDAYMAPRMTVVGSISEKVMILGSSVRPPNAGAVMYCEPLSPEMVVPTMMKRVRTASVVVQSALGKSLHSVSTGRVNTALYGPWIFHLIDEARKGGVSDESICHDQKRDHELDPRRTLGRPRREERLSARLSYAVYVYIPMVSVIGRCFLANEAEDDRQDGGERADGRHNGEEGEHAERAHERADEATYGNDGTEEHRAADCYVHGLGDSIEILAADDDVKTLLMLELATDWRVGRAAYHDSLEFC